MRQLLFGPRPSCLAAGFLSAIILSSSLLLGCAGQVRPLSESTRIGNIAARLTSILMKEPYTVTAPLFAGTYTLPPGEYFPMNEDGHGIYYAAPLGITRKSHGKVDRIEGGIHMPRAPGHYYSFFSLYLIDGGGRFRKLPLPDRFREGYGRSVVFRVRGEDVPLDEKGG